MKRNNSVSPSEPDNVEVQLGYHSNDNYNPNAQDTMAPADVLMATMSVRRFVQEQMHFDTRIKQSVITRQRERQG